eukprot:UN25446
MVLEYSFDEKYADGNQKCQDNDNTGLRGQNGKDMTCSELSQACSHQQYGKQIREVCKKSCGQCSLSLGHKNTTWHEIEFANLPGDVYQRPKFNSPYHYRLDWQIWIRTTASME